MRIFLLFIIAVSALQGVGSYQTAGYFTHHDNEKRFLVISLFLPYNPRIFLVHSNPEIVKICSQWWQKGDISSSESDCDFLWLEKDGDELDTLQSFYHSLKGISVIYTTTHNDYNHLEAFLAYAGFTLLSHWYWEGEKGNAIFLRKDLFEAGFRSLNYSSHGNQLSSLPLYTPSLQPFFRRIENKEEHHSIDQIDYLYMINLDERPEKFALASGELQLYGIDPYRFSAVNGWNLPTRTLEQIGVRFSPGTLKEKFMGSRYLEVDGQEYFGSEFIREDGTNYFSLAMSHGAIGIVLSHLSILQDAYDSGHRTIWVMEDDVEVIENPSQISHLIPKLDQLVPDWDILFTDTDSKNHQGEHVPCRCIAARPNMNMQPLSFFLNRFFPISDDFSRTGMRYGAYSMILRRSGIEKILNFYKTYGIFLPYDMDYWLIPDLKMYTPNKDIISHRAGAPSDNGAPNYKAKK
jgi:GR25 family glycosyltransferase involved in LPS biosynthesis